MRKMLAGSIDMGVFMLEYYLIAEPREDARTDYGVELCSSGGEQMCLRGITVSRGDAETLIALLMRNAVTPVTLCDVVEDWLP